MVNKVWEQKRKPHKWRIILMSPLHDEGDNMKYETSD